jgi:RNA polymerase sigma-70 factor, ECF subfamily
MSVPGPSVCDVSTTTQEQDAVGPAAPVTDELEQHRRELTGYCYRMLGSAFDAEDAVQEAMVRAWRAADRFEGRSSVRSWLYRIATNVCLDMIGARGRRATPMDLSSGPSAPVASSLGEQLTDVAWLGPVPDERVVPVDGDPADVAVARESVRLAFVAALQHLPPRQRAVLILRDVLRWSAEEVAALLGSTTAAANSALQRARATMAARGLTSAEAPSEPADALDDELQDLLARYVDAFERYDMAALVTLLHADATQVMPPYAMWLRGADDIAAWMLGVGSECRGSRLVPLAANGTIAFGQYRPSGPGGSHRPWAVSVLEVSGGRVSAITAFLDVAPLFPLFGLPEDPSSLER